MGGNNTVLSWVVEDDLSERSKAPSVTESKCRLPLDTAASPSAGQSRPLHALLCRTCAPGIRTQRRANVLWPQRAVQTLFEADTMRARTSATRPTCTPARPRPRANTLLRGPGAHGSSAWASQADMKHFLPSPNTSSGGMERKTEWTE